MDTNTKCLFILSSLSDYMGTGARVNTTVQMEGNYRLWRTRLGSRSHNMANSNWQSARQCKALPLRLPRDFVPRNDTEASRCASSLDTARGRLARRIVPLLFAYVPAKMGSDPRNKHNVGKSSKMWMNIALVGSDPISNEYDITVIIFSITAIEGTKGAYSREFSFHIDSDSIVCRIAYGKQGGCSLHRWENRKRLHK